MQTGHNLKTILVFVIKLLMNFILLLTGSSIMDMIGEIIQETTEMNLLSNRYFAYYFFGSKSMDAVGGA